MLYFLSVYTNYFPIFKINGAYLRAIAYLFWYILFDINMLSELMVQGGILIIVLHYLDHLHFFIYPFAISISLSNVCQCINLLICHICIGCLVSIFFFLHHSRLCKNLHAWVYLHFSVLNTANCVDSLLNNHQTIRNTEVNI